ncbi:MAG: hypothetical protein KF878_10050 [Planctomycetes bacterium]|nr:hypothetical protein [Planctomycetota bacterium]
MVTAQGEEGELRAAWRLLRRAWGALRRRWPTALAIAGLAAAAVALRLALQPDRYEARGLLQVGLNIDLDAGEDFRFAGTAARVFYSQVELLSSERVLTEAAQVVAGESIPPGRARDEALEEFLEHVAVRPVRNTFLVAVEAWDPDPRRAAERVNALFDVYVRSSNEFLGERYRVQNDLARRRERDALEALRGADARREAFLARWGEVSFEARGRALAVRSGELEARAARVDVELATIAAETSLVATNIDPDDRAEPEVMLGRLGFLLKAKELLDPLHEVRGRLARAEAELEPEHPAVRLLHDQVRAQAEALRASLRTLSEGRREELRHRSAMLGAEQAEVVRLLAELERERFRLTELQADHERLLREVAYYERELEATRASQWRTEGRSQVQLAAAVLAPAEVPHEPSSPFKPLVIALIALGALTLGAASVIVWDQVDDTLRPDDDLAGQHALEVLARIPAHDAWQDERALVLAVATDAQATATGEAFRLLRTNALHALAGRERPVLLITSAVAGEGKTLCAVQLATVLARTDGPILLIEGDLRRPRLSALLGVEAPRGLSQVLLGGCALADAIVPSGQDGLSLLPAGPAPASSPGDLLTPGALSRLFTEARAGFRAVVIDSPPVLGLADTSLLAPHVDGVLLVVRLAVARRREVEASLAQLRAVGARPTGLVVNGLHQAAPPYEAYGARPPAAEEDEGA